MNINNFICSYNHPYSKDHSQFFIIKNASTNSDLYKFLLNRDRIECLIDFETCELELLRSEGILSKIILDQDKELSEKYLISNNNLEIMYKIINDSFKDRVHYRKKGKKPIDKKSENKIISRRRIFDYEDIEIAYRHSRIVQ